MKKKIVILGSTGSIGTQALDIIEEHSDLYEAYALTANNSVELLIKQARKFLPEVVVIANKDKYPELKDALCDLPIKVYAGADAICQIVQEKPVDIVLASMVGYAGLRPTIEAIKAGKVIALANKETLVVAGELITSLVNQYNVPLLPVDSEHSAIFQCLEMNNNIEKIILTASGGPFRNFSMEQLQKVTKELVNGCKDNYRFCKHDEQRFRGDGSEMVIWRYSRTDRSSGSSSVCNTLYGAVRGWSSKGSAWYA